MNYFNLINRIQILLKNISEFTVFPIQVATTDKSSCDNWDLRPRYEIDERAKTNCSPKIKGW